LILYPNHAYIRSGGRAHRTSFDSVEVVAKATRHRPRPAVRFVAMDLDTLDAR
jgi:hypothetical protein